MQENYSNLLDKSVFLRNSYKLAMDWRLRSTQQGEPKKSLLQSIFWIGKYSYCLLSILLVVFDKGRVKISIYFEKINEKPISLGAYFSGNIKSPHVIKNPSRRIKSCGKVTITIT